VHRWWVPWAGAEWPPARFHGIQGTHWDEIKPCLCFGVQNQPAEPQVVHLSLDTASQGDPAAAESSQALATRQKPAKSFHMHVGGALHIPTKDAQDLPQLQHQAAAQRQLEGVDPFEVRWCLGRSPVLPEERVKAWARPQPWMHACPAARRYGTVSHVLDS
jgi:hypothetical protein